MMPRTFGSTAVSVRSRPRMAASRLIHDSTPAPKNRVAISGCCIALMAMVLTKLVATVGR